MRERHAVGNDVFYRFRNVRNASGKRGFIFEIRRRAVRNYGSVVAQKVFSARRAGGRETVGYENNFPVSFVFINKVKKIFAYMNAVGNDFGIYLVEKQRAFVQTEVFFDASFQTSETA